MIPAAAEWGAMLLVLAVAGWSMWIAVQARRPGREAPLLALATWWLGTILYVTVLLVISGGIVGLVAGAVERAMLRAVAGGP